MNDINVSQLLDTLVENIAEIPSQKQYWLIRTQSGTLYDNFIEKGIVGLEHKEVSQYELNQLRLNQTLSERIVDIKHLVRQFYENSAEPGEEKTNYAIGLIASQIAKFYFNVKKGDLVLIPSQNSDRVSFGVVEDTYTVEDSSIISGLTGFLYKRVKWIQTYNKNDLDPYIYRILTSHQAIVNITGSAEIIERSLKQFFVLNNQAHLIINVRTKNKIKAHELFGLGYALTELIKEFIDEFKIQDVSIDDLDLTINLNSPGKINLFSVVKKSTIIAAVLVAIVGGGFQYTKEGEINISTDGLPNLIKSISDFLDRKKDRELKETLIMQYKDSLEIENTDELINLLKQLDTNKDLPKTN